MIPKFKNEYVSYEELLKAYKDCRKRKRGTYNSLEFEINENINLYNLWYELNTKTYEVGKSIVFCVDRPVKREVFAANFRDRIVHHLVINQINDILEEEFIEDSYSCRVNRGTDYGIRKCYEYVKEASENYTKDCYVVKCDLKSFFMTINKQTLYNKLCNFLKEKYKGTSIPLDFLYYILEKIIFNEPNKNCIMKQGWEHWNDLPKEKSLFFCKSGYGLPIGNLTSQIFANFYLSEFDHFIKDILCIKYYGRYVDDFFFICYDIKEANKILDKCRIKLKEMGVNLHPKKLYIQHYTKGIKFIGAVIKPNRIYISNRTKGNLYWTLKQYYEYIEELDKKKLEPTLNEIEHFVISINSYLGFLIHYKTFNIRKNVLLSKYMKPWLKYCYYNSKASKLKSFYEFTKIVGKKKRYSKTEYTFNNIDVFTLLSMSTEFCELYYGIQTI